MKTGLSAILVIISVLLAAGGCDSTQGTSDFENKVWKLESYGEQGSLINVLEDTEITVTFDSGKDQVQGSSGANIYSGSYKIEGNKLSISELVWTEMYRMEPPGVMEQEEQYLNAFNAAESLVIQNDKLKITTGKFTLIYFLENSGILQGLVTIGPITPVEKLGENSPVPPEVYETRKVMVYDRYGSNLVAQVDINSQGRYLAKLEPGIYTVDINHIGIDFSKNLPKQVEIKSGVTMRLDINIDTGIR